MIDFFRTYSEIIALIGFIITVLTGLDALLARRMPWTRLFQRIGRRVRRWLRPARYRGRRILLNLSGHPVDLERARASLASLGWEAEQVTILNVPIPTIPPDTHFLSNAAKILEGVDVTEAEWQTAPLLVIPPGYAPLCAVLMAELHGRMGYFPQITFSHQKPEGWQLIDAAFNLQDVRMENRGKRYGMATQQTVTTISPVKSEP